MKSLPICLFFILLIHQSSSKFLTIEDTVDTESFAIPLTLTYDRRVSVKDTKSVPFNDDITPFDLISQMEFGWSLGNTLDAAGSGQNEGLESETSWGNPYTTQELIQAVADKGFKTIRLPVSWHNHIIDDKYTIDPKWINRVKTIVDWAIDAGCYVILNSHHDNADQNDQGRYGKGYYPTFAGREESEKWLLNTWTQIAEAFNNGYDEHLIFEDLNEPRLKGTEFEWNYKKGAPLCEEGVTVVNEFHRLFHKIIRESGGNNAKRFLLFPGMAAGYTYVADSDLIIPGDRKYNPDKMRMLVSVHMYLPYNFCMEGSSQYLKFTDEMKSELDGDFNTLYARYVSKGYFVVIGETGAVNKNNTEERAKWGDYFIPRSRRLNMASILWDNANFNNQQSFSEVFGFLDRHTYTWQYPDLIEGYVNAGKTPLERNPEEDYKESYITAPVVFNDTQWKVSLSIHAGEIVGLNKYTKLFIKTSTDVPFTAEYKKMKINDCDYKVIVFNDDEITGAKIDHTDNSLYVLDGEQDVEITLNDNNMKLIQSKGIVIIGYGFKITAITFSGPRIKKFEPLQITKSSSEQKVTLYFNNDATSIAQNLKFYNFFFDVRDKIKCEVDYSNPKNVICKGIFDLTGEYEFRDDKDHPLLKRFLYVIPQPGEKYDIDNLIDTKKNFDEQQTRERLVFEKELFESMGEENEFYIETNDLFYEPDFRNLKVHVGIGEQIMQFSEEEVNVPILADKSLKVPNGRMLIKIKLNRENTRIFKEQGTSLSGYGFAVYTVFFKK